MDHAWRAVHEMTVKSKAIAAAHYGRGAQYAYWIGCSSGGRQGLKEAQRFAADYDGISAGAPANNWVPLMAHAARVQHVMTDPATRFTPEQLDQLKEAAIAACDARDGVTDRVVEDPRAAVSIPAGSSAAASNQMPVGRTSRGGPLDLRRRGKSPNRADADARADARRRDLLDRLHPGIFPIGGNYFRDLVLRDPEWDVVEAGPRQRHRPGAGPGPGRTHHDAGGPQCVLRARGQASALARLDRRHDSGRSTIDYYESALAASGSAARTSMRLFMMPGVDHCGAARARS